MCSNYFIRKNIFFLLSGTEEVLLITTVYFTSIFHYEDTKNSSNTSSEIHVILFSLVVNTNLRSTSTSNKSIFLHFPEKLHASKYNKLHQIIISS